MIPIFIAKPSLIFYSMIRSFVQAPFVVSGAGIVHFREASNLFLHLANKVVILACDLKYFVSTGHGFALLGDRFVKPGAWDENLSSTPSLLSTYCSVH